MLIIGLIPLFLLFIPIPGTGLKVKDFADIFAASPILLVTAISLCVTSAMLFIGIICNKRTSERSFKHLKGSSADSKGRETYTVFDAVCVGLMQCVAALFPGVSRSGSTLAVGEMRGINKQKALDYTFVLGTPAIIAAAAGYLAIWVFKWFLKTDKMMIFVIYTAVVGVALIVVSLVEIVTGANLFTGAPLGSNLFPMPVG